MLVLQPRRKQTAWNLPDHSIASSRLGWHIAAKRYETMSSLQHGNWSTPLRAVIQAAGGHHQLWIQGLWVLGSFSLRKAATWAALPYQISNRALLNSRPLVYQQHLGPSAEGLSWFGRDLNLQTKPVQMGPVFNNWGYSVGQNQPFLTKITAFYCVASIFTRAALSGASI